MENYELKPFLKGRTHEELKMFVADFWARGGWRVDRVWTNDESNVDVYIQHPTADYVVGMDIFTHHSDGFSEDDVKDCYYGFTPKEWADVYSLVTTSKFDRRAQNAAQTVGCDLIGLSALSQAIIEYNELVLCEQYDDGFKHIGSAKSLKKRFQNIGIIATTTAAETIIGSEVREALIGVIERADKPDQPIDKDQVHALEANIIEERPSRPYPLKGGYAPAWSSYSGNL